MVTSNWRLGWGLGEEDGGDLVETVEVGVGVFPRDPGGDGIVEGIGQDLEETEWEGDGEFDSREAHEAEVAIGVEARGVGVEELLDHVSALEKGTKGEDSVDDGDEGEEGGHIRREGMQAGHCRR
jgi:hypothetical protein